MVADYISVKGYIKDGKLEVDLPDSVTDGEVEIKIPVVRGEKQMPEVTTEDETPWTDEEIAEMVRPEPMTGAEIVAAGYMGGWEHKGIADGVEFIEELRRKRREKREWQQD